MLKSMNVRDSNYESSLDAKDMLQMRSSRRDYSRGTRDRTVLVIVCFAWKYSASLWYDLSQGEICKVNGTGIGRFVYIQSSNALIDWQPCIFGSVVWECEMVGYGTPPSPAIPTTGYGPLTYAQTAPIYQPVRPRWDIVAGTYCGAFLMHATNIAYPIASMPGSATPVTCTLNSTAYNHQLPTNNGGAGYAYSFTKRYYTSTSVSSLTIPQIQADVWDTNLRCKVRTSGFLIEDSEYFRLVIIGSNYTSGAGDNGGAMTIYDGIFQNGGTSGTLFPSGHASAAVAYAVKTPGTVSGTNANLTETSTGSFGGAYEAYFSGAYSASLGGITLSSTCDAYGRITAISVVSSGPGNFSVMVVGGT